MHIFATRARVAVIVFRCRMPSTWTRRRCRDNAVAVIGYRHHMVTSASTLPREFPLRLHWANIVQYVSVQSARRGSSVPSSELVVPTVLLVKFATNLEHTWCATRSLASPHSGL